MIACHDDWLFSGESLWDKIRRYIAKWKTKEEG